MKQPVVANVIEFPSKLIMVNTSNILAAFIIAFLTFLSQSSVSAKHNLDVPNVFEKHLDHKLQPFLREKRQKEAEVFHLRNSDPLELEEELSEPKLIYERRVLGEETRDDEKSEERKSIEFKTSNDIAEKEEDAQDDAFSYRSMHDVIQALILADEEAIAERLQQLREVQNVTKSERSNNLPKRQAIASAAAAAAATASNGLLGANLWDVVPLVDLDTHSCEVEAFSHGHLHVSGTIVHEFFCELRKFWHYGLIILRNLKSGLTFGPLIATDVISDGILGHLFHHTSHLLHVIIREPHHLLILPDIIQDAVPFPSIVGAIHRLRHGFFKVLHFGFDLFRTHVRHVLAHLFSHRYLGVHLRDKLHHLGRFGSILPLEEIVAEPVVSTAAATATATATVTTTTSSDSSIDVPDYQRSWAEILSSLRGFYNGYYASGVPHLIRTCSGSISVSSAFSKIGSYLSKIPFFSSHFGPVEQSTTVAASSASSSIGIGGGPIISPVVTPLIEPTVVPVAPAVIPAVVPTIETASSSASAAATAIVAETQPVLSARPRIVPSVVPCESTSLGTTAAAATATATATAAASQPVASGYPAESLIQSVPILPEVAVPSVLENNVATASASAAASSVANVVSTPVVERVPLILPLRRPILSTGAPEAVTAAATAVTSASTSTGGRTLIGPARYRDLDLDIDRRIRYPLRSRVIPAVVPSLTAAASSAAAAATAATSSAAVDTAASSASAVASSSASSVFSDGFSFVLPREQIVGALGYDYLLPGDIISVTLKNKSILFGRVLDATSPIRFSFLKPKIRASLLRHGGRVWNLLPRDFRDPECFRKFNNPLLLRYSL